MMNKKINIWKLLGIIAFVAVINFGLAGCKTDADDDGGGGGGIPTELVGKWGKSGVQFFDIKADGSGTWGTASAGIACSWSVSGKRLSYISYGQSYSIEYSVSGDKLTLSGTAEGPQGAEAVWSTPKTNSPLDRIK